MHWPHSWRPPDKQDKRAVVPIEPADCERWLMGTVDEAAPLVRVPPTELYNAQPVSEFLL